MRECGTRCARSGWKPARVSRRTAAVREHHRRTKAPTSCGELAVARQPRRQPRSQPRKSHAKRVRREHRSGKRSSTKRSTGTRQGPAVCERPALRRGARDRRGEASRRAGAGRDGPGPACGTLVGRAPKNPALMRDYARARDLARRGSPPSATTSTIAAISLSRSACVSPEVLRLRERERIWVWLEKRSATRLIWIPSPMMLPRFPPLSLSLVPLAPLAQHLVLPSKLWVARGKRRTYRGKFVKGP